MNNQIQDKNIFSTNKEIIIENMTKEEFFEIINDLLDLQTKLIGLKITMENFIKEIQD